MLCFSTLFYLNLRHNYVAMMSSLNSCNELASQMIDLEMKNITNPENPERNALMTTYGKFCFMSGNPKTYNWYLSHPFDKALVEEGMDGYSAKITGSFIDTL